MIPGNPYITPDLEERAAHHDSTAQAVLALAFEQHQRNRLAAITARSKALTLPTDLAALAAEGDPR